VGVERQNVSRKGFIAVGVLVPLLGTPLGVNGSAIFQIIALENLGLDARQVGLAVGLGALSIPFQLWATRIPLRLARRHLTIYVAVMSALCAVMAWLIGKPISPSFVIVTAVLIAVSAEIAVSVLWATSWQPVLSSSIAPRFRQWLNAQARAANGLIGIVVVVVIGSLGDVGRTTALVLIGITGVATLPVVRRLPILVDGSTDQHPALTSESHTVTTTGSGPRALYGAMALAAIPAWPFIVTYAATSFWPSVNIGLIGAMVIVGPLVTAMAWRPTTRLLARAQAGTAVLLCCALVLSVVPRPVSGMASAVVVIAIVVVAGASGAAIRLSLLEVAHGLSTFQNSVRVLTLVDVVASTSMQLGFLSAGYLIGLSTDSTWLVDPFNLSLIATPIMLLVVLTRKETISTLNPTA